MGNEGKGEERSEGREGKGREGRGGKKDPMNAGWLRPEPPALNV